MYGSRVIEYWIIFFKKNLTKLKLNMLKKLAHGFGNVGKQLMSGFLGDPFCHF
jgi:hypothetical protein